MLMLETRILRAATHCAAKTDIREYFTGVLIERTATGEFFAVSCDGHVISVLNFTANCAHVGPWQLIIPLVTIKAALKDAGRWGMGIKLSPAPNGYYMLGDAAFSPLDWRYPDWRRVIPRNRPLASVTPQINPALLSRAQAALAEFDSIGKHSVGCHGVTTHFEGSSIMTGATPNACAVVMPYRAAEIVPFMAAPDYLAQQAAA